MKRLAGLGRAYLHAAAAVATLLGLVVAVLFAAGALRPERLRAAVEVLRAGPPAPHETARPDVDEGWKELEAARRASQKAQEERARELDRLDALVSARLAALESEKENLARARREHDAAAAAARKAAEDLAAAKSDAEMTANVPILSRMDGASILSLMKGWEDERIVRYLRAMRPSKAAEVLEAMRTEPEFEPDFRRPPPGAPPGARTRAELLMEEFKK